MTSDYCALHFKKSFFFKKNFPLYISHGKLAIDNPTKISMAVYGLNRIKVPGAPLDRRSLGNSINPLQEMRERLHVLLRETGKFPTLNPRPGADVGDGVFAFAFAGKVVSGFAGVFA